MRHLIHPRENDLIIGTHGRGAFILDDVTPLQNLTAAMSQDAELFDIRPGALWQSWQRSASLGQRTFVAENPPTGAFINFYTKKAPEEPVTIVITDEKGIKVREWTVKDIQNGVHRTVWDLQHDGPTPLKSQPPPTGFFARFANQGRPRFLGYRQYPRIREELRSLARAISDAAARLTEP